MFTHGEDERLARALLSLVNRNDFYHPAFAAWLTPTTPAVSAKPAVAELRASQNWKNALAKLECSVSNDPRQSEGVVVARTALRGARKEPF